MPDDVRLYLVSTLPQRACWDVFRTDRPPAWARVVSDVGAVRAIPAGSRSFGFWFEGRERRSELEWVWRERIERGELVGLGLDEMDAILARRPREGIGREPPDGEN